MFYSRSSIWTARKIENKKKIGLGCYKKVEEMFLLIVIIHARY